MKEIPGIGQRWYGDLSETNFPHPLLFLGTFTHFQYYIKLELSVGGQQFNGKDETGYKT